MKNPKRATSFDKKLGNLIREVRVYEGMSQERLAELVGVSFQQIQKYEYGTNRLTCARLVKIAKALGRNPGSFFAGPHSADGV